MQRESWSLLFILTIAFGALSFVLDDLNPITPDPVVVVSTQKHLNLVSAQLRERDGRESTATGALLLSALVISGSVRPSQTVFRPTENSILRLNCVLLR